MNYTYREPIEMLLRGTNFHRTFSQSGGFDAATLARSRLLISDDTLASTQADSSRRRINRGGQEWHRSSLLDAMTAQGSPRPGHRPVSDLG